jgi:glycosyltransferase involved in cell wall biosynthesis
MKALVVTPYYHPVGGGLENYARQLNRALNKNERWQIVIATAANSGQASGHETVDGFTVYRLKTWFKLSNTPVNLIWPLILRRIIKHEKPDVIIAHSPVPSMADAAALAAGKTPFIVVYHAATLLKKGSPIFNLMARLYGLLGRYTFYKADRILPVSDFVRDQLPARLQSKAQVVPNAIWPETIISRRQPKSASFIFISSLDRSHAWKGLSDLIEAMAIYKRRYGNAVKLTVVGDGNYRANYEAQVAKLNLHQNIKFVGAKHGQAKDRLLGSASALIVYPTTNNDAFPTVILEAWAKYVPVLAAKIGALPSLLNDRADSYLTPAHSPADLAADMHRLANRTATERTLIAKRAADRARRDYSWQQQAKLVNQIAGGLV